MINKPRFRSGQTFRHEPSNSIGVIQWINVIISGKDQSVHYEYAISFPEGLETQPESFISSLTPLKELYDS